MRTKRHARETKTIRTFKRIVRVVRVTKTIVTAGPLYVAFGATVRNYRLDAGMTQADLAAKIGLSRASIANIEVGRQRVVLSDLFDFAKALGTDARKLLHATVTAKATP